MDWYVPSPRGRYVAFGISQNGDERSTLRVMEVATGRMLPEAIAHTKWCRLSWLPDESGFYFTRYPREGEAHHDPAADRLAQRRRRCGGHADRPDPPGAADPRDRRDMRSKSVPPPIERDGASSAAGVVGASTSADVAPYPGAGASGSFSTSSSPVSS